MKYRISGTIDGFRASVLLSEEEFSNFFGYENNIVVDIDYSSEQDGTYVVKLEVPKYKLRCRYISKIQESSVDDNKVGVLH